MHRTPTPRLHPGSGPRRIPDLASETPYFPTCVHHLFEVQVAKTPCAPALEAAGEVLRYEELNRRAEDVAARLRQLGAGPESLVGICADRSPQLIAGVLGILKAGAAYVPLDASYPRERLALMFDDAQLSLLVTQSRLAELLPTPDRVLLLDEDGPPAPEPLPGRPLVSPSNAAYVMYTSGSTGRPKGVVVEHASVSHYARAGASAYGLTASDRVLQFASLSFDGSVEEIFCTLTRGATLVLRHPAMLRSIPEFIAACAALDITVLSLPTAFWHELVAQVEARRLALWPSLRLVTIGGERALPERLEAWNATVDRRVRLFNSYGPTETTVVVTMWEATRSEERPCHEVPIGKPLPGVDARILDPDLEETPPGERGELYIGGVTLARGYLGRPGATALKFISDPSSTVPGARLYRTGDLARRLPDGNLEFCGRVDDQVKIRGYRVEPGEIDEVLRRHGRVRDALTVVREEPGGPRHLVSYVVPRSPQTSCDVESLRAFLKTTLPDYMIPARFVPLAELPLSPNGKIDRAALSAPVPPRSVSGQAQTDPHLAAVVDIFRETLGVAEVKPTDDFFALGGDSLLALRALARLEKLSGRGLSVVSLRETPTAEALAMALRHLGQPARIPLLVPLQVEGSRPPFFCVHSFIGAVCTFLARHTAADQPFYGFQPRGLDGVHLPHGSIEEMAACYVREMRRVRPHGPYHLGGYCFGGLVALEMTRQLHEVGEQVGTLIIVDIALENYRGGSWRKRVRDLVNIPLVTVGRTIGLLRRGGIREALPALMRYSRLRRARREVSEEQPFLPAAVEQDVRTIIRTMPGMNQWPENYRRIAENNWKLLLQYRPRPYGGPITLIRRERPDDPWRWENRAWGWDEIAPSVEVHEVGCEHDEIMNEPHVRQVATLVDRCLRRTSAG